jgi:hypothetical protein
MVTRSLQNSEGVIRALNPATLTNARAIGRKQLPVTVAGLVVHLAEHTQRHVGELIITTKLARMTELAVLARPPLKVPGETV